MHFQAYLLEGLSRWNEDRANAAVEMDVSPYSTSMELYSGLLKAATNDLSHRVFGKPIHPSYCAPRQYTGELIGIEYLYSQTGEALQDLTLDPDSEEARDLEDFSDDEDEGYDEPDSAANDKTLSTYDLEPRTRKSSIKRRLFKSPDSAAVTSNRQASLTDEGTGGETPTFHDSPKVLKQFSFGLLLSNGFKDTLPEFMQSFVVYKYTCPKCNFGNYIGSTQRLLKGLVIAGLGDLKRPAEKLSVTQSGALAATGIIWSRYSLVIIPKNWGLFSVNLFVAFIGLYQLSRIYRWESSKLEFNCKYKV
ncbi:uncharacterized protein [Palaemon carinicauda]|uniref:uncharacterized protein n=1 Tax=Palaemon carinicauda TaxID=392227 RepID=UPI0035B589C9